jgi:hypothetical protein
MLIMFKFDQDSAGLATTFNEGPDVFCILAFQ